MLVDFLKIAYINIKRNKIRTFLTTLSIIISIGSLIALLSLSQGLSDSVVRIFEDMGKDKIFITTFSPMALSFMPSQVFENSQFTDSELKKIRSIEGVEAASPLVSDKAMVSYRDEQKLEIISAIPLGKDEEVIKDMQQFEISNGRDFDRNDRYKVILGCKYNKDLFTKKVKLNDKITIFGKNFKVIGFLKCLGSDQDDSTILIPMDTYKELTNRHTYTFIIAKAKPNYNAKDVAKKIKETLRKLRNLKKGKENFEIRTSEDIIDTFNKIMFTLNVFIIALSIVSLIVSGFVIMNSIYTSVLERKKEIGILKAIGARNSDVALLFISETIILSLFGGVIGLSVGFGVAKIIEMIVNHSVSNQLLIISLNVNLILFSLTFSLLLGLISTLYPSLKAAKLNPVEAIRS